MKNKLLVFISLMLVMFVSVPVSAQQGTQKKRVADNAGLLDSSEKQNLEQRMAAIASQYNFDLVIVTEKSINKKPMDFADDYFDYNGYGLGGDRDGCLMLQVTGTRDFWFSTSGRGIKILNSIAGDKLEKDVVAHLKNDDPARAYMAFIDAWEEFLELDAKGRNYNIFHQYNIIMVLAAWILSFLFGSIVISAWKRKMNTALPKKEADSYIVPESLNFTQQNDRFLYSTVSKTKKEAKSSSSSGGGIHTSSSGRSHGGRGGKY